MESTPDLEETLPPPSYADTVRRKARRGTAHRGAYHVVPTETTALLPVGPVPYPPIDVIDPREGYFRALVMPVYWLPVLHLAVLNFPFALVCWLYLFIGVLVGTTLLLTLPLGALIWWLTLVGSRSFTKAEISLQSYCHDLPPISPPLPVFNRAPDRALIDAESAPVTSPPEPSFLQNTYAMFLDPTSYRPIFYFLVIKAAITLLLTPLLLALLPPLLILIIPAPFALRIVRRIGLWQAKIAMDGLQ